MNIDNLNGIDVNIDEIQYIVEKYRNGQNVIVVAGEFNSGKSSFINCFVNKKDFLPYGKTECTPVLIDVCEGEEGKIEVRRNDGTVFEVDHNKENLVKYAKYDENANLDILSIDIPLVNSGLPMGTHLIDTPGTNTVLKEHEEITRYVIKKADAVLYLFNKVISKSDVNHINDILQFTPNIIFVLTHSDEIDTKTGQKYTKQRISELISEAKKEISAGTSIDADDLVICNIGSVDGFDSREEIEGIMSLISSYVKSQTKERRKRVAQRKIENILQTALDNYFLKNELIKKQKALDENVLEAKIKKFENEQTVCEKAHNDCIENIDRTIGQQEELCKSELSRLLTEEKNRMVEFITTGDASEKSIERKIRDLNSDISAKMRSIIEDAISSIIKKAYDSVNNSLESINCDFDISVPLVLTTPDIKDLDDSRIASRLSSVKKQIEENQKELTMLKENSSEDEREELEKKIRECEVQKEAVADNLIRFGAYRPEFITVKTEGGSDAGRIAGRVIGEIADLALLIWNPAAGAAKGAGEVAKAASGTAKVVNAADKAKDITTIFRYIKSAAGKAAETNKEVNEKKEKMKKAAAIIKRVDDGRREIIDRVQNDNVDEPGKDGVTLSAMLDMLSIGHWTEKLGGAIGEAIKPTTETSVENLEVKADYENKRKEITEESARLSNEIYNLKDQLNAIDDFGKQRRIETEIKEKIKALEEKEAELEKLKKREEKQNSDDQIRAHMINQFDDYERSQYEKGVRLIQAILSQAKIQIIERVTTDYYEKLDYYNDAISELREESISGTSDIMDYENIIATLSGCISEVGAWLE